MSAPPSNPATGSAAPPLQAGAAHCNDAQTQQLLRARSTSSWSFREKVRRTLWIFARASLFRMSFHNWYAWRRMVLRMFGARIAPGVRVRPTARIEMPWNLQIDQGAIIGDYAILYSLGTIRIGALTVISQYAHLCTGTHDHTDRTFPLVIKPISIGTEAWIAADAFVGPGVCVGDRSVVGARATVIKDVPQDVIVVGNPARVIGPRVFK